MTTIASTSVSTTIIIPGRETQTIPGLNLSKSDVIASFAGDIDLGQMTATETNEGGNVTIAFANKTGTKGSDVIVNVAGDVIINTRIEIPGREAQLIPGVVMTPVDVRAAFAGEIELGGMDCTEACEGTTNVISFANKTGTKGQTNVLAAIFEAVQAAQVAQAGQITTEVGYTAEPVEDLSDEDDFFDEEDEDEYIETAAPALTNTRIVIPGREAQVIPGIVLDAQMVKDSFSGEIDLSGYNVEEIERGNTLEVIFTARTGTKGEA